MEQINHPKHYTSHPSGIEAIEICEQLGFNLGNAFKYLFRRNMKHEDPITDLRKALWYVRRVSCYMSLGFWPVTNPYHFASALLDGDYDVYRLVKEVIAHETPSIALAMAYLVRGHVEYDMHDKTIAASFIEKELACIAPV